MENGISSGPSPTSPADTFFFVFNLGALEQQLHFGIFQLQKGRVFSFREITHLQLTLVKIY